MEKDTYDQNIAVGAPVQETQSLLQPSQQNQPPQPMQQQTMQPM